MFTIINEYVSQMPHKCTSVALFSVFSVFLSDGGVLKHQGVTFTVATANIWIHSVLFLSDTSKIT